MADVDDKEGGRMPVMQFHGNVKENWRKFKVRFKFFLDGKYSKSSLTNERKIGLLMTALGDRGVDIYESFLFEETPSYDDLIDKFDDHFSPQKNTIYERYVFSQISQQSGQRVDDFVLALKTQARACEFAKDERDNLIRDRIVVGVRDSKLREDMLRIHDLTLETAMDMARTAEISGREAANILPSVPSMIPVEPIRRFSSTANHQVCSDCGYNKSRDHKCPALGLECHHCHVKGHFTAVCPLKAKRQTNNVAMSEPRPLSSVTAELQVLRMDSCDLQTGNKSQSPCFGPSWHVNLKLNNTVVRFKVDTGAECNVLTYSEFLKIDPLPLLSCTNAVLKPYASEKLIYPVGRFTLKYEFYVIRPEHQTDNLLCLQTCEDLGLVHRTSTLSGAEGLGNIIEKYNFLFEGLGKIPGYCRILLKSDSQPVIARNRRFAFSIQKRMKESLDKMVNLNVITPVTEPTPWVSNILAVEKHNATNDIRICLDPKDLNSCILVPKYHVPTAEEILIKLSGKKIFTVLDLSSGFWQLQLDDASSYLTTFQTPFGRYRVLRVCFGLNNAPELFLQKIVEIFGGIDGCCPYFDDLIIAASTSEDHDIILKKVLDRAAEFNVRFNREKLQHKKSSVKFLGMILSEQGAAIDPDRCSAICQMPRPTDKRAVFRFLGMIKYLNPFIADVAAKTEHLRNLTHANVDFQWTEQHEKEFALLKEDLTKAPVLRFYDTSKALTIQADSSQSGLGACLLQEGSPIGYASRALTPIEQRWSQIEKEMLSIVFAAEKFHNFIYGHTVVVQSDHKPLESIFKKSIDQTSARLQRLRLRLLKYRLIVQYTPGSRMYIADTLSRAYLTEEPANDDTFQFTVHANVAVTTTAARKQELIDTTAADPTLKRLMDFIQHGWPQNKRRLSSDLCKFWTIKHLLTTGGGLIFYENRIIVPPAMQQYTLNLLHSAHAGITKTKQAARQSVFWLGMSSEIELLVNNCEQCQRFRPNNVKEPLKLYPATERPFQRVSSDIFQHEQRSYLVIYDTYSCWLEIFSLQSKAAKNVIEKMKTVFARFGVPEQVVSDNVPYNSVEYQQFAESWNFEPIFTSPHYPQANGFAEKGVAVAKALMQKSGDWQQGLLQYRNTPVSYLGYSPAQLVFGRMLKTLVPVASQLLQQKPVDPAEVMAKRDSHRARTEYYYNRSARDAESLQPGQQVLFQHRLGGEWNPGIVQSAKDNRSYVVQDNQQATYLRNRRFIRKPARFREN